MLRTSRRAFESLSPCGLAAFCPWLLAMRLRLRTRLRWRWRWRLRLRLPPGRLCKKKRKLRKWSPGGATIDPRGGQHGFLEVSGGLLGKSAIADLISNSSETGSGRLLGRSWQVLGPSWDAVGAYWGGLGTPGALPGGSGGGSRAIFWERFVEVCPGSLIFQNFS